jgi:hypothetical protein
MQVCLFFPEKGGNFLEFHGFFFEITQLNWGFREEFEVMEEAMPYSECLNYGQISQSLI